MVCLRDMSVDTLHKGDTEDDDDDIIIIIMLLNTVSTILLITILICDIICSELHDQ